MLLCSFVPVWAGDTAATFFDDTKIHEIRIYFDDANWYSTLYNSHRSDPDDPYFPARFIGDGVEIAKIGARFKGNSSFQRNGVKKPFKLDFNEYEDSATFLGLKKLNLHNGDIQPDFMHEKMFLDFAGKYIGAMKAAYVKLYVNDAYYGLYLAVEQPDKAMMQRAFGSDEDGNLWEAGESVSATMSYLGTDPNAYYSRYELKTNEEENDYSGLINMLDILNNTATAELPAKIEPVMDIENVMQGMALNALYTNLESYLGTAAEYFLYQRSADKQFVHVHWDTNETFGSTGDGTPKLSNPFTMDPFYLPTSGTAAATSRPLLTKLWAVPQYKRLYLQSLARFLRDGFDETTVGTRATELANLIRTDYAADPNKAYTMAQFETALTSSVNANGFTTYGLTQFVRARASYLNTYLAALAEPADIRLNEVVAVNDGTKKDDAGDADPWVEIHNLGPGSLSTSGFYLSDDPANPTKWALPSRTLAAGEFLVLWLDSETGEGDTHSSIKANAAGGALHLYATAVSSTSPIDSVTYGTLSSGQAYARTGLFGSSWSVTTTPTYAAANSIAAPASTPVVTSGTLLVNELMADNSSAFADPDEAGAYEDWFEVYNPGTAAVDMSGMYISDNLTNPTKWQVPSGVTIPAGGYLVFMADGDTDQGSRHTSWSLGKSGESIGIYAADGTTLIDSVTFGAQTANISYGRSTDGGAEWSLFTTPTPGTSNLKPVANWIYNAASHDSSSLAPLSIATAKASGLTAATDSSSIIPLPTTLGGVTVTVTDSGGASSQAGLSLVTPDQIDFQLPESLSSGRATVAIQGAGGATVSGDILIASAAPGLFSADGSGSGVGLISAVRTDSVGNETWSQAFQYADSASPTALPIALGAETDKVYLQLYGTGFRNSVDSLTATLGGISTAIVSAEPHGDIAGIDQVRIGPLSRTLAGKGIVAVQIAAGGKASNTVTVTIE